MAERDRLHRRHSSVMPANPSAHHRCLPSSPPPPAPPNSSPTAPSSPPPSAFPIPPFIYPSSSLPLSSAASQMEAPEFRPFLFTLLRRWCVCLPFPCTQAPSPCLITSLVSRPNLRAHPPRHLLPPPHTNTNTHTQRYANVLSIHLLLPPQIIERTLITIPTYRAMSAPTHKNFPLNRHNPAPGNICHSRVAARTGKRIREHTISQITKLRGCFLIRVKVHRRQDEEPRPPSLPTARPSTVAMQKGP